MHLAGLQKFNTIDYPGKLAAVVFTMGCNLRCPYCHNPHLVLPHCQPPEVPRDYFFSFLDTRQDQLDGVVVSGGEPTLHVGLHDFIRDIRLRGFDVKLDTNGTRPKVLHALIEEGLLDYVALDLKAPPHSYPEATGRTDKRILQAVQDSVHLLRRGRVDYELRTTVVPGLHTPQSLKALRPWVRGARRYILQAFRPGGTLQPDQFNEAPDPTGLELLRSSFSPWVGSFEIR